MSKHIISFFSIIYFIMILVACQSTGPKSRLTPEEQAKFISEGKAITMFSFKAFSKELSRAINDGGIQYAVDYCHLKASPLVDSLSRSKKVKISRISSKYRNLNDKPDQLDQSVLDTYQEQLDRGDQLQPHLEVTAAEVIFYSPILILDPVCLNCHGEPGLTMLADNLNYIKSKYPEDLAYGYKLGDLRGAWKIVMNDGN